MRVLKFSQNLKIRTKYLMEKMLMGAKLQHLALAPPNKTYNSRLYRGNPVKSKASFLLYGHLICGRNK